MTREQIELLMARIATWPDEAQAKFVRALESIEETDVGLLPLSDGEQAAIDEGLADAERGDFASEDEVRRLLDNPLA